MARSVDSMSPLTRNLASSVFSAWSRGMSRLAHGKRALGRETPAQIGQGNVELGYQAATTPPASISLGVRGPLQRGLESANKVRELDANRVAYISEFKQVQPPRPGLILAHKGLWMTERVGHIGLVQSLLFPNR